MRSIARRHPLAVFLAIAYGASAAIFALPLLSLAGIGVIDLDLPGVAPFVLLDTFALAGAAFITTALAEGRSGVRELRRRVFNFRVNPGWYALAILLLPVTAMATAIAIGGVDVLAAIVGDPVAVLATIVVASAPCIRPRQPVGGGGLDRLRPRAAPAPAGSDRRQRRDDLAPGPRPRAARVRGRRGDRRSRAAGADPVLPRGAVRPADPGPDRR